MFSDVDEQLLLQELLQDVLGCHVHQRLQDTRLASSARLRVLRGSFLNSSLPLGLTTFYHLDCSLVDCLQN
jgi:hypothetical protein